MKVYQLRLKGDKDWHEIRALNVKAAVADFVSPNVNGSSTQGLEVEVVVDGVMQTRKVRIEVRITSWKKR